MARPRGLEGGVCGLAARSGFLCAQGAPARSHCGRGWAATIAPVPAIPWVRAAPLVPGSENNITVGGFFLYGFE